MMTALLNRLFPSLYWQGRLDGWQACEDMVLSRIKEHYPDDYATMLRDLVQ